MLDQLPENWLDYLMIFLGIAGGLAGIWIAIRLLRKPKSEAEAATEAPSPEVDRKEGRAYLRINMDRQGKALPPPLRTTTRTEVSSKGEEQVDSTPAVQPQVPQEEQPPLPNRDRRATIAISEVEALELEQQENSLHSEKESLLEEPPMEERTRTYPKVALFDPTPVPVSDFPRLVPVKITQQSETEMRLSLEVIGHTLILEAMEAGPWNELSVSYSPPIFRDEESYAPGTKLSFEIEGVELMFKTYQMNLTYQDKGGNQYRQEIGGMGLEMPILEEPKPIAEDFPEG